MSKVLAIDYGAKNIGLALSDENQHFSFAYNTLNVKTHGLKAWQKVINDLKNICQIEKVDRVIVGMPIGLSGSATKKSQEVFEFTKLLQESLTVPVEVEDERYTTVQASKMENKNARNIDELSAQILLQGYLDGRNRFNRS